MRTGRQRPQLMLAVTWGELPGEILGAAPPSQPQTLLAVHLWRFSGGYPALMDCMNKLKQNKVLLMLG